jgi:diguanylate cyclase (GGDEF)-like protein
MTKPFIEPPTPDTQDFLSRFAASHTPESVIELFAEQDASGVAGGQIDAAGLGKWSWGEGGVPLIDADLEHGGRPLGRLRVFGDESQPMGMLVSRLAPIIIPMTARIVACSEAERRARVDGLTGVLNRSGLLVRLREELQRARRSAVPVSLLLADVDNMKALNDGRGHHTGDQALCRVADALRASLRGSDIVGRLGGDEFVAVLPDARQDQAEQAAERVRCTLGEHGDPVGLSIGIASGTGESQPEELLRDADQAMYRVKHGQGGRVSAA